MKRGTVIEPGVVQQIHQSAAGARLGVVRPEMHLGDAGQHNGTGAHGTRLESDIKTGFFDTPTAKMGRGGGDGEDFRVGGGVLEGFSLVVALADDGPVVDDDASDGDFVLLQGPPGLGEGLFHKVLVFIKHARILRGGACGNQGLA